MSDCEWACLLTVLQFGGFGGRLMAQEKIAVVTGSSSGIGLATSVELALNGYRVVATMRDMGRRAKLEDAAQKGSVRDRLDLRRVDITETDSLADA